ncbi:MAG: S-layer homology domain-containing protein [Clostridia bacterium]|nr:S-layer homology domain-containing protein [Clostridia bacterium]
MNIKRIFTSALCAILMFGTVYADSLNVSYNPETELININGSFDDVSKTSMYSIEVKKLSDDSTVYTSFDYANGNSFSLDFALDDDCEATDYYVSVMPYSGEGANSKDKPLFISSAAKKDDVLKNVLSNQTDKNVMASLLNDNLKYLGLNAENCDYFSLTSSRAAVAERLLSKSFSYEKYGEFLNLLNFSVGIEMLNNADENTVISVFEKYKNYFGLENEICYPIYSGSDKEIKNQAAVKNMAVKSFVGKNLTDLAAIKKYFNENLLLAAISNVVSPGEITMHIEKYKAVIPFSLAVYDASDKEKTAIYITSLKRNYTDMNTLEGDVLSAYNNQNTPSPNGGSSSSKGGSSDSFYAAGGAGVQNETKESFSDVSTSHWAYETIEGLKSKGVVSGDEKGCFNPDSKITREEFAKMLVSAFGLYDENAECAFNDVLNHWSYKYVASLYKEGITKGIDENNFGCGANITREDMATLCAKAAKLKSSTENVSFTDAASISDYALASVTALCESGAVKGFEDNTFRPKNNATRAQAAAVIYSLIK